MNDDAANLSEEQFDSIARGLEDIKAGRIYSTEEVVKRLKLDVNRASVDIDYRNSREANNVKIK